MHKPLPKSANRSRSLTAVSNPLPLHVSLPHFINPMAMLPPRSTQPTPQRNSTNQRGYDGNYRKLRKPCFLRDAWTCVDCGWMPEIVAQSIEVGVNLPPADMVMDFLRRQYAQGARHLHADHQLPVQSRPDLRLDLTNLRTRCNTCHHAKTLRETATIS